MIDYHFAHKQKVTFCLKTDSNYCISQKAESTFPPESQKLLFVQGLIATICQKADSNHLHKKDSNHLVKGESSYLLRADGKYYPKADSNYLPNNSDYLPKTDSNHLP